MCPNPWLVSLSPSRLVDGNPLTCLPPIPNGNVILQADVTPMPVCPMPSPSLLLGDIDSDGDVDIADVIALSMFLTGSSNGEGMDMDAADMDQNGTVEVQVGKRGRLKIYIWMREQAVWCAFFHVHLLFFLSLPPWIAGRRHSHRVDCRKLMNKARVAHPHVQCAL